MKVLGRIKELVRTVVSSKPDVLADWTLRRR